MLKLYENVEDLLDVFHPNSNIIGLDCEETAYRTGCANARK